MTYARPTEPLHVVDVLIEGFRLLWAGIRLLYLPAFLLALIVGAISPIEIPSREPAESFDFDRVDWLRFAASLIVGFYMYAVITAIVHYVASGAPEGVPSPLFIATRRFPTILAVNLMYILAVFAGTLLLIVPGIFVFVGLYFCPLLPITEGRDPTDSIRGSLSLIKGHWGRTLAVAVITIGVGFTAGAGSEEVALLLSDRFDSDLASQTISSLTLAAFEAIIYSLSVCVTYSLYQDLRLRQNAVASA
ncbi:MAG: hypothetical protein OXH52_10050 [Gammaproteobacteria bacterium]|nr:hypothetical protein [Gammaproteobacteria bacterium]